MISETRRQRVARFEAQRERYLQARSQVHSHTTEVEYMPLLANRRFRPAVVAAPLIALSLTMLLDLIYLLTGDGFWARTSFSVISIAVIAALTVAVPGAIDWLSLPASSAAKSVGVWYLVGNVVVAALFVQGWYLRLPDIAAPGLMALTLSCMGAGAALLAGWLTGEFIDRLQQETVAEPLPEYTPGPPHIYQMDDLSGDTGVTVPQRAHA